MSTDGNFADALARARKIAAKIDPGVKRTADDTSQAPVAKKPAVEAIVAQIKPISNDNAFIGNEIALQALTAKQTHTENLTLPDNLVGMIIGKGGEQITRLQAETGCKIQIAPDSSATMGPSGIMERQSTLTGTAEAIGTARSLLLEIVRKGKQGTDPIDTQGLPPVLPCVGHIVVEMGIPGQKAGLIIGRAGDTIKRMQEEFNVKMIMIQDSNKPSFADKPLRIQGEQNSVNAAKKRVLELLSKDDSGTGAQGGPAKYIEIPVPRPMVGMVIGRGGDVIRKIQSDSGAHIQFKKEEECPGPVRICVVQGASDKVMSAKFLIDKIIAEAQGGPLPQAPQHMPGYNGMPPIEDQTLFPVPSDKCGLVIGKGGDTIRQIKEQTGAFLELSRDQPSGEHEKLFRVRGTPDQIRHSIRLICEKAGMPIPPGSAAPGQTGPPAGWGGPGAYGGPHGFGGGWPGAAPQGDAYSAYPGQPGMPPQQPQPAAMQQQNMYYGQTQHMGPGSATGESTPAATPAAADGSNGQPDYSTQWAEYYRQQGYHDFANMILQQAANRASGGTQAAQSPAQPGVPQPAQAAYGGQPAQPGQMYGTAATAAYYQQPQAASVPGAAQQAAGGYNYTYPGYAQ